MFLYTAIMADFTPVSDVPGTIEVTGTIYRIVPHYATDPLSTLPSFEGGGRWHLPDSFPVLHTCGSVPVAWAYANWHATNYGLPPSELPLEQQPDLVVLNYTARVADLVTDPGLLFYGLPVTYPQDYIDQSKYGHTRSVGRVIYDSGLAGVACRSAQLSSWAGPIGAWAEVAIFTSQSPPPTYVDRLSFGDWYGYV